MQRHDIDALALSEWHGGEYRDADDETILSVARTDDRVLVTFDCQTIPTLLKELAETGQAHAGVILVSSLSYRANDVGGPVEVLRSLVQERCDRDWREVVVFLR